MDILISVVGIFVLLGIAVRYKRLLILLVKSSASVTKGLVSYLVV